MKNINIFLFFLILIHSQAQTFDEILSGNLEYSVKIYENENILITNYDDDTIFSGFLAFQSDIGSVTIRAEVEHAIRIIPITTNDSGNILGSGTQIGQRPPVSGGGVLNAKITLYPNPAANSIQLQSTENIVGYKIYDSRGTLKSENKLLRNNLFSANINNLTPGIYYINILLENGQTISKQFIKK